MQHHLEVRSWEPGELPTPREFDLVLRADLFPTGWNRALARQTEIKVTCSDLQPPAPRVISVPIGRASTRVKSFFFAEPVVATESVNAPSSRNGEPQSAAGPKTRTRVKPPGDVIKLEDRLRYVLQPSLESLLESRSLTFPFRPFPYQWEGIAFLYPRQAGILADEMGLGKTMQAIAAVRLLLHAGEVRKVLLVCPKPLVANWRREFEAWAPEVPLVVIEGDQARRRWQWELSGVPVKVANYELLHRDREVLEGDASGQESLGFDLVILDESQRIKNRASATSQAAQAIRRRRAWALTGTPIENSPEDLVGIFDFLVPGYLSSEMTSRRMARAVGDYVLRRAKEQVLPDLPPKLFRDAELDLTPEQHDTYKLAEGEGVLRLTELGHSMTIQHVFELVLRLKQICNFDPATGASAKLERLEADLEEVAASGRKAIVFSQWVETLQRLSGHLERFGPLEFHGKIPPRQREAVLQQFREDAGRHVLLISYGAGGVGLNLEFAGYVFLFDRWWNPAVEDQAVNRAHRIGSSGPVTVTRFLMLDTIEERIERILREKRDMFDAIFSSSAGQPRRSSLTQQEIFGLFDLQCPGGPLHAAA